MSSRPTYAEDQRFISDYNALACELAMFHDADGKTDVEIANRIVEQSLAGGYREWLDSILAQGKRFLEQRELPMELIADHANRYLTTEAEQRAWLERFLSNVQAALAKRQT